MNFPVGIIDEEGKIVNITINEKLLVELSEKLRKEGTTAVHTTDDKGIMKTYNAQAVVMFAKGCKGKMMYLPMED